MNSITFFDIEVSRNSETISDIGSIKSNGLTFHSSSLVEFKNFISDSSFVCGHNIIKHDLKYIAKTNLLETFKKKNIIDTLYLSPLLFPNEPYHKLLKDDKLQSEELNNPVNDSKKAQTLFFDELNAFNDLDSTIKNIYYLLLKDQKEFKSFFKFKSFSTNNENVEELISDYFKSAICSNVNIVELINKKNN